GWPKKPLTRIGPVRVRRRTLTPALSRREREAEKTARAKANSFPYKDGAPMDLPESESDERRQARAITRRVRVALGREPGDLLMSGGRIVNVFTRSVEEADVVVADGRIAGVGRHGWEASRTIDLAGRTVIPGLIDTHMHLESTLLTPAELSRLIVPR